MTIRFDNVTFRYPGGRAGVFGIDFEVARGELLAVIGPSGSGKSTLLKVLAGFLAPESGRVLINDRDVTTLPPRERNLGVVFQSYALFPHMTAWQNVAYPLKVRGVGVERRRGLATEALANVGLADFANRLPGTLSGGQQQRVALARALVFEPSALLLDEPLSALDMALRGEMRDEIVRVQREAGIATLHVTHDQEEALSMGHRVVVMDGGEVLQLAPPRDLYDRPVNRTVAAFVGRANLWHGEVVSERAVSTPIGRLECSTDRRRLRTPVVVMVRPESVRPLAGEEETTGIPNRFAGSVSLDRFLGAVRRYDFEVRGGVIRGETTYGAAIHAVQIPPEAIRLLPEDDLDRRPR